MQIPRIRDENLGYIAFRQQLSKNVVIGNPGGGKSTLCQYICFDYSKRIQRADKFPEKETNYHIQIVPIKIILRTYILQSYFNEPRSITKYIRSVFSAVSDVDSEKSSQCLDYLINSGQALILFDGLDEVLDVGIRRNVRDNIESFAARYPLCKVLVTTRSVGYEEAPMNDHFKIYHLAEFEEREVADYVTKFFRTVDRTSSEKAAEKSKEFIKETTKTASDLRRNPLMLGLMTWLYYQTGSIPANRPEVYEKCSELMYEKMGQKSAYSCRYTR